MLSEKDISHNWRAVEHALAQQALEGLAVPPAAVEDLERVARGEMTTSDALRNAFARYGNAQILKP
ncbi:MAG TPA: antitoxin VbhA family protein [Pirellulales bacterium]|nr:antitoxin VbhA family protein [Pirellulales bacterium]